MTTEIKPAADGMITRQKCIRKGQFVHWRTMFGDWMSGEVIRVRKDIAFIRRTIGGVCTIHVSEL